MAQLKEPPEGGSPRRDLYSIVVTHCSGVRGVKLAVAVVILREHAERRISGDSAVKLRQETTLAGNHAARTGVGERIALTVVGVLRLLAHIAAEDVDGAVDDAVAVAILHN